RRPAPGRSRRPPRGAAPQRDAGAAAAGCTRGRSGDSGPAKPDRPPGAGGPARGAHDDALAGGQGCAGVRVVRQDHQGRAADPGAPAGVRARFRRRSGRGIWRREVDLLRRQRALRADLVPGERLLAQQPGSAGASAADGRRSDRLPEGRGRSLPRRRDPARAGQVEPLARRRRFPLQSGGRPAVRRLTAIGVLLAAAAVALVTLGVSGTSGNYRVDALFDNADYLISGQDVKIAGARVGQVAAVKLTRDRKARVEMRIDPGFAPFRANAECSIRPQSLIGEKFVECEPGDPSAAPLGRNGGSAPTVAVTRTHSPVDLDLVFTALRLPLRQRLSIVVNELGAGLAG